MSEEKKEAPAAAKKEAAPKKKGGMIGIIILMTIFGALVPFIYPTLFLFVGMAPTLVALFTSDDRQGSSATAIGALNIVGIMPFIIELWQKGQTLENALAILGTPETWFVILGAAAVGQLILFAVPQAIATATLARAEARLKMMKDNLERLKAVWGPDVATTKPLDRVARGQ